MKRLATSVLLTASVPLVVIFVLTARPARLYAEEGVYISCADPDFQACAGQDSGVACSLWDAYAGTCQPNDCHDPDGGTLIPGLQCVPNPVPLDGGDAGIPTPSSPDGGGSDAGGSDAGAGGTPAEGCSCGAAGVSSSGALSSGAGLLLAFGAMLRVRRRRSTRPPR